MSDVFSISQQVAGCVFVAGETLHFDVAARCWRDAEALANDAFFIATDEERGDWPYEQIEADRLECWRRAVALAPFGIGDALIAKRLHMPAVAS